jgi:prepilin-type N-terminal cleavage/methylation domain-containing protein
MTMRWHSRQQAFTLVEIMIVVALIGLLLVLAIPSVIKARKQAQGRRIVNDARIIDHAVDAWAMETGKADGDEVDVEAVAQYGKNGQISTTDVLGNSYGIGPVGPTQVVISATTRAALAGVGVDWGSY